MDWSFPTWRGKERKKWTTLKYKFSLYRFAPFADVARNRRPQIHTNYEPFWRFHYIRAYSSGFKKKMHWGSWLSLPPLTLPLNSGRGTPNIGTVKTKMSEWEGRERESEESMVWDSEKCWINIVRNLTEIVGERLLVSEHDIATEGPQFYRRLGIARSLSIPALSGGPAGRYSEFEIGNRICGEKVHPSSGGWHWCRYVIYNIILYRGRGPGKKKLKMREKNLRF